MGQLTFQATLGGAVNLVGPNTASTTSFTLPSADGTSGQFLSTNGSGTLSFASQVYPGAGIPNSTGTAWGTSYTTSGSGTVLALATNPTITNYVETPYSANSSTAITIALTNGTVQIITLTGNCTYTFPTATAGKSFMLLQLQDATGSRTVTWPSSVKWPSSTAPTITSTASKGDKFVFTADGTYWWGSVAGQNYL